MKRALYSWQVYTIVITVVFFSWCTFVLFDREVQTFTPVTPHFETIYTPSHSITKNLLPLAIEANVTSSSLSFVGDVMLARSVESWMRDSGASYPFVHVPEILGSSSVAFANFEAAIPIEHEHTAAYSTRFGADAQYLSALSSSGITHVSLANNHAFDYGRSAEEYARKTLTDNHITPFGDAEAIGSTSVTYVTIGSTTVGVLGIQTVYGHIDQSAIGKVLSRMGSSSDVQIVYVHWGTEYAVVHTKSQEDLAMYLVAHGADVIIGHHPHVVEDVGLVDGVPVFYSLGNFIFDQYFSTEVQQGLALRMGISNTNLTFTLLPVTSIGTHAQPRLMTGNDQISFLDNLAKRSIKSLETSIRKGEIVIPRGLQNAQN